MSSIYDFPDVCDVVLDRPPGAIAEEVRSIRQLLAGRGVVTGSILEVACGTCPHGILLAQHGFAVTGIDRSPAMIDAARKRASVAGVPLTLVEADLVDFDLDKTDFDAAIFPFETFPVITERGDVVRHFNAIRCHLRPGGSYSIDIDQPKHDAGSSIGEWGRETIALANGLVETWKEDLAGDPSRQIQHLRLRCRIQVSGLNHETIDDWQLRVYRPDELIVLARSLAGWSFDGFYAWGDLSRDITKEQHYAFVLEAIALLTRPKTYH
jgi:SAM-dependent methyltransferase